MAKASKNHGKRSGQGTAMAARAHEATAKAMADGFGAPGARAWTQANGKAKASKAACRGSW